MPMLTTSVMFDLRTLRAKPAMAARTALTSGITSLPATRTGVLARLRSAVCSTARCSVVLMMAPANMSSRLASTSQALASAASSFMVRLLTAHFE